MYKDLKKSLMFLITICFIPFNFACGMLDDALECKRVVIVSADGKALDSWEMDTDMVVTGPPHEGDHEHYRRQIWKITKEFDSNGRFNGCYFIKSLNCSKVLDACGRDTTRIGKYEQHNPREDGYASQLWKINKERNDNYFIWNEYSGARLDSWGGSDGTNGKTTTHYSEKSGPIYNHQLWKIRVVEY